MPNELNREDWWDQRQKRLLEVIEDLSGRQAREILQMVVEGIVTDTAGNVDSPFAYMWQKQWRDIERKILS